MGAPASQPPLLPSSESPERLRGLELAHGPEDRWKTPRAEANQWVWLLVILAVFGLVIGVALLLSWLLRV